MKKMIVIILLMAGVIISAAEEVPVHLDWLKTTPEVMTYTTQIDEQDEGFFQLSSFKTEENIEVYINIISKNFTKTISGIMTSDIVPISSNSKIIINSGVIINTNCNYQNDILKISTQMKPYNKNIEKSLNVEKRIIDHSQIPIILRLIALDLNSEFTFDSINPRTNEIVSLTIKVLNEEVFKNIKCLKIEMQSFEGVSYYWIEKETPYRILKIDQPKSGRVTTLLF